MASPRNRRRRSSGPPPSARPGSRNRAQAHPADTRRREDGCGRCPGAASARRPPGRHSSPCGSRPRRVGPSALRAGKRRHRRSRAHPPALPGRGGGHDNRPRRHRPRRHPRPHRDALRDPGDGHRQCGRSLRWWSPHPRRRRRQSSDRRRSRPGPAACRGSDAWRDRRPCRWRHRAGIRRRRAKSGNRTGSCPVASAAPRAALRSHQSSRHCRSARPAGGSWHPARSR